VAKSTRDVSFFWKVPEAAPRAAEMVGQQIAIRLYTTRQRPDAPKLRAFIDDVEDRSDGKLEYCAIL
jgi:hypothetical protein